MEAGRWVAPCDEVPTLGEGLKQYTLSVVADLKGAESYQWVLDDIQRQRMAAKALPTVTAADVSAWRDAMAAKGLKPGTVVRRLGLLSGFFTWAHKEKGWITGNPVRSVRKPRVNDARDRVLSTEEQRWLLAGARSGRQGWLADALVVLLQTAMRRSELWSLTVADVDHTARVAMLADTKNGTARGVPLTAAACEALARLATVAEAAGDKARAKNPAKAPAKGADRLVPVAAPPAISLAYRRALARGLDLYRVDCASAGRVPVEGFLQDCRVHDIRHTSVTAWASTGALSVHELMAVSGHKTQTMLFKYCHAKPSDLAAKLAGIVQAQTAPVAQTA
jgi:integrase